MSAEDNDMFHHEDTTQVIISYLSEDARFCFALTSKNNKRRVDDCIKRDDLYRDKTKPLSHTSENDIAWSPPLALRRARILYDAVREGHLDVLKWLALDQKVRVDLICGPTFARHSLFKPFSFYNKDYLYKTYVRGIKILKYEREFSNREGLFSLEVAARYGRENIVTYFDVKYSTPDVDFDRQQDVDMNHIIGGYQTCVTFRGVLLSPESIAKILERAPPREVEHLIRSNCLYRHDVVLERFALRGDVELLDSMLQITVQTPYGGKHMLHLALLSKNLKMVERVVEMDENEPESSMSVQQMRERYVGNEKTRLGIESFTNCKEMTDDIIECFVMARRKDYLEDMLDIANDIIRKHK